jgi:hypothetical protein
VPGVHLRARPMVLDQLRRHLREGAGGFLLLAFCSPDGASVWLGFLGLDAC